MNTLHYEGNYTDYPTKEFNLANYESTMMRFDKPEDLMRFVSLNSIIPKDVVITCFLVSEHLVIPLDIAHLTA